MENNWDALKSNMDRFIESLDVSVDIQIQTLKSNMDRFIEHPHPWACKADLTLKSNMDRFIGFALSSWIDWTESFKIQYG